MICTKHSLSLSNSKMTQIMQVLFPFTKTCRFPVNIESMENVWILPVIFFQSFAILNIVTTCKVCTYAKIIMYLFQKFKLFTDHKKYVVYLCCFLLTLQSQGTFMSSQRGNTSCNECIIMEPSLESANGLHKWRMHLPTTC